MKRIGIIAVTVWAIVLASLVVHAVWAHHVVSASTANYRPPKPTVHRLMLVSEGRDVVLAVVALVASVFIVRSRRRAPSVILTVVALLALFQWGVSFLTVLQHSDRNLFNTPGSSSFHFPIFWHTFLEPSVRWVLAAIGLVCGIIGITSNRKKQHAEPTTGEYSHVPRETLS